jgi:hypothetical protein
VSSSPFLRIGDVAARYGTSTWTIHERARLGLIPHRKLAGGSSPLLFIDAELTAYENGAKLEVTETPGGGRVVRPR